MHTEQQHSRRQFSLRHRSPEGLTHEFLTVDGQGRSCVLQCRPRRGRWKRKLPRTEQARWNIIENLISCPVERLEPLLWVGPILEPPGASICAQHEFHEGFQLVVVDDESASLSQATLHGGATLVVDGCHVRCVHALEGFAENRELAVGVVLVVFAELPGHTSEGELSVAALFGHSVWRHPPLESLRERPSIIEDMAAGTHEKALEVEVVDLVQPHLVENLRKRRTIGVTGQKELIDVDVDDPGWPPLILLSVTNACVQESHLLVCPAVEDCWCDGNVVSVRDDVRAQTLHTDGLASADDVRSGIRAPIIQEVERIDALAPEEGNPLLEVQSLVPHHGADGQRRGVLFGQERLGISVGLLHLVDECLASEHDVAGIVVQGNDLGRRTSPLWHEEV
mmetsp:Transcript_29994/g.65417  ORF Transcript_29994/g.65417 Transcript_29994/m.65417 type:complete len:395 (+) Transcript_29994:1957-3141(+)